MFSKGSGNCDKAQVFWLAAAWTGNGLGAHQILPKGLGWNK
jgi:hypothetical protein